MAELTDTGLDIDTVDQIEAEIKQDIWDNIDASLDLSAESPDGQMISIYAEREAKVQELALAVLNARRVSGARGTHATEFALITGTQRRAATKTLIPDVDVVVDDGFSKAPGEMVAHLNDDANARFVNKQAVTNSSGVPATVTVDFEAETAGATPALANQLQVIAEPLTGWTSVDNASDGITGLDDETDPDLMTRREDELAGGGSTTADAIRAAVLRNLADNVTHCRVLENETNAIDANGLPAKSFEVIARGLVTDTNASIALARQILTFKCGGMQASGAESQVITDSQGNEHTIGYTWVTPDTVYLEVDVEIDTDTFPADGDAQIKAALVAVELDYEPGDKVVAEKIKAAAFSVVGVTDVPAMRLGLTASPVGTANLTTALRHIADLDTARVLVTHV